MNIFNDYLASASFDEFGGFSIAHWQSENFERHPERPIILFIHGFPSASCDWHAQWQFFQHDYRLISLDLLGLGLSEKPYPHRYSLLQQADIVEALLTMKGVEYCHILAHDYGNSVTQELLRRHGTKNIEHSKLSIQSVCFLNGGLFASHHRPLVTQKVLKSSIGPLVSRFMSKRSLSRSFHTIFGDKTPPNNELIELLWTLLEHKQGKRVLPALLSYIDERQRHSDAWLQSMTNTQVPLYFINGIQDPISGQHMLDRYIEVIPNPRTSALNVGHYPQLEAPEYVNHLYADFLQQVTS